MTRLLMAMALGLSLAVPHAAANDFPTKPIRVLIPYGPGGATDISTRIILEEVRKHMKQPLVVENKPGGSGVVALNDVLRSGADGHTLIVGNITTNLLRPIIGDPPTPFDPFKDFVPVIRLVSIPNVLIVTKVDFPPSTLREFVDYAKQHPGKINHTVAGILNYSHLDWLTLQKRTGIELVPIPLKAGAGGGQTDIINGQIHAGLQNAATVMPFVKSGRVKAIAVANDERLPGYPDVPTFGEQGFSGIGTSGWQALFAPAGTPKEALDILNTAFNEALKSERVRKQLLDLQYTIIPTKSPAEAQAWLDKEREEWRPKVADALEIYRAQEKKAQGK
jgi:tripartite-type tricarboxylate transporter receptor subunit TctC